jgi:hypothetical protein
MALEANRFCPELEENWRIDACSYRRGTSGGLSDIPPDLADHQKMAELDRQGIAYQCCERRDCSDRGGFHVVGLVKFKPSTEPR